MLVLGWNIGTANSQTVTTPTTVQTTAGQATTSQTTTSQTTAGQTTTDTQTTTGTDTQTTTGTEGTDTQTTDTQETDTSTTEATTASSGYQDGTYTGQTATHRYGSVTVTVTISGGAITNLTEDVVSDGDHHSERINEQAVPIVKEEVLSANSAQVNTVSGGTYTTEAYLQSLQSALDQAS